MRLLRPLAVAALTLFTSAGLLAQNDQPAPFPLWDGPAPGALGTKPEDIPTLTRYDPAPGTANGASLLILPGGGYGHLAPHEGAGYAEWFITHGITCYVLKYRLGTNGYHHPCMIEDASRGLRLVRSFARRDGLDPARVGVIGSSAGGHLASTLLTHYDAGNPAATDVADRESSRPDLGILCYPVITLHDPYTHAGSRKNLLGETPDPALVDSLSNETQVTADTPPCFLWQTVADTVVPVENSLMFANALQKAGVPFALHIYQNGPHGLGLGRPGKPAPPWADQLLFFLQQRHFIP